MAPIRFLHVSDTHFGPTPDFDFYGKNPHRDAKRLLNFIASLECPIDCIVHTGDLVSRQDEAAYALAFETLKDVAKPMYFVTGNHDSPAHLGKFKKMAPRTPLVEGDASVSYTFELRDLLGIVLDVKHSNDDVPSGVLPQVILDGISSVLERSTKRFLVFTHFPLLSLDAPWVDAHLLVDRGEALHAVISSHAKRCAGVFLGHIHQATAVTCDGVSYFSAPSTTHQFRAMPSDVETLIHSPEWQPGCNLVTIDGSKTIVKYLSLPREAD